jgi:molybdopterin synthase catalytic subunit
MLVRVRLFAMLRERAGSSEVELELPEGARVSDALAQLEDVAGGLPVVMAVNRVYADRDAPLHGGDELALIPPVSGGDRSPGTDGSPGSDSPPGGRGPPGGGGPHVRVTEDPLSLDRLSRTVRDPRAGAVVTFQGVTRQVQRLDYEAYVEMAEAQMSEIVRAAIERHGLCAAAAEHRVGSVPLSEPSVAIAVSAPHRAEAFAAAREIIDEIKARVPIWKRELEEGRTTWVPGTTPSA